MGADGPAGRASPLRAAPKSAREESLDLRGSGFPPHRKETTWPTVRKTSSSCSSVALYGMLPTNTDRAELERDDIELGARYSLKKNETTDIKT
jgi:hypothetical protein